MPKGTLQPTTAILTCISSPEKAGSTADKNVDAFLCKNRQAVAQVAMTCFKLYYVCLPLYCGYFKRIFA